MDIGNIKSVQPIIDPATAYEGEGPAVPPLSPPNSEPVIQTTQPQEVAAKAEEKEPKKEDLPT